MNIKDYKNKDWINVSKGNWSFLSCSDFINCYTREVLIKGRNSFDHPLQVCVGGNSELWFLQSEKDSFGSYLVKTFDSMEKIENLCSEAKKEADSVLSFVGTNKPDDFDSQTYKELWSRIRRYYAHHLSMKYICDYLPPEDLKKYQPIIQEARVYCEALFDDTEKLTRGIIKSVSQKSGLEERFVAYLTREELWDFFDNEDLPKKFELEKRYSKSVLWSDKESYGFLSGEDAEKIESFFYNSVSNEISGQVAFKGIVKGIVRIVENPALVKVFNKGDILVTGMTRPDYISLVEKSAGIVTDAGGLLSHAAIIARELKKPCVTGTKIATKVLKDGDMVEVDAERGIVRIIK